MATVDSETLFERLQWVDWLLTPLQWVDWLLSLLLFHRATHIKKIKLMQLLIEFYPLKFLKENDSDATKFKLAFFKL